MDARHVSCDRFTGVSVITCNRCGKENQDHYKFCLGCGSELAKPVAAPAPPSNAPSQAQAPQAQGPQATDDRDPALDRTVLPPAPMGTAVAGELRTSSPAVPKARGGIPWGDSPKMPAPIPFQLPPNPLAAATPPPRVTSGANGGAVGIPAGATPAPMRVTGGPPPAAVPAAGGNEIPAPPAARWSRPASPSAALVADASGDNRRASAPRRDPAPCSWPARPTPPRPPRSLAAG